MPKKLSRSFYLQPTLEVSKQLLGKVLVRKCGQTLLRGRIVETEAYTGALDPGSHAFRGPTPRNQVMFGVGGHLYVYFTYGMHYCMNVVTDPKSVAGAALLRAAEPLQGVEIMQARRRGRPLSELCNGPAKLCQAFGVSTKDNGLDLMGDLMWIEDDGYSAEDVASSRRIGLSNGHDLVQRFFLPGNQFVSHPNVAS